MTEPETSELVRDGVPVLRYVPVDGTPPTADFAIALASRDTVVGAVMDDMSGWQFATEDEALVDALLAAGCELKRHCHLMTRSLQSFHAPAWPSQDSLEVRPLTDKAEALVGLSLAAYPPGHPDAVTQDPAQVERDIDALLTGSEVGPLLAASSVVYDGKKVVALAILNRMLRDPPKAGPWVSDVCRDPSPKYAGLGGRLLTMCMRRLVEAGETTLSLVVTDGNPARGVYERLGFTLLGSFRKLLIPSSSASDGR